jgi:hypothetical protein
MLKRSSFETTEDLQNEVTGILISTPTPTSEQYSRNRRVDCCDGLRQGESIFANTSSQQSMSITKGDKPRDRMARTPYSGRKNMETRR